jgi:hypothetical protein
MSRAQPHRPRHPHTPPEPRPEVKAKPKPRRTAPRVLGFVLLGIVVLVTVLALIDVAGDRPLRGYLEHQANARLKGYTVRIGAVDFSPWNFSLDLFRVTILQDAHPTPPVAEIPRLNFNVQWHALLRARVVADMRLESPRFFLDLAQLREEWKDRVNLDQRGWQDALFAVYPLKVNTLKVLDGAVTYLQVDAKKPLQITHAHPARDIRNVECGRDLPRGALRRGVRHRTHGLRRPRQLPPRPSPASTWSGASRPSPWTGWSRWWTTTTHPPRDASRTPDQWSPSVSRGT